MARTYSTDEVMAMMQAPREDVQMLDKPASPFLDPTQINAAERELSDDPNFFVDQTPAPQRPDGGNAALYPSRQETQPSLPKPVYSTDEVMALYTNESKPVYSTKDVMKQMIAPLYDPTAPRPSRDEYFKLKDMEKSLKESGDIEDPGAIEMGLNAVGGFLVTAADALNSATWKVDPKDGWFGVAGMGVNPAKALTDTWRESPATARLAGEMIKQQYGALTEGLAAIGGPKYRVKETGEFVTSMQQGLDAAKMGQAGGMAGVPAADDSALIEHYKKQGLNLVPVGEEDLKDWEYQQWGKKMDRNLAIEKTRTAEAPPEFLYRAITSTAASISDYNTGRNDYRTAIKPVVANESQAVVASMFADPAMYASFGAGAARLGLSAAAKGATAETLGAIGKFAQKVVQPTEEALTKAEAFKRLVVSPAKVASAYGAASGVAWAADKLELPSELKTAAFTAASLYGAYKAGVGVLRFTANKLPEASVILRESANATNGFDAAARKAVAANADVPYSIRERLLRPSQFVAMESTPARLAKNMELSPGTRAMMDKLSNWYVVQGVRGASAVTTGAVKGTAASVPFAELMRSAGDEESAAAIYGMGAAFGSAGGAAERAFGARGRRFAQAESDIARFLTDVQGNATGLKDVKRYQWIDTEIGRLLTDVELGAGDVSALVKNRSFDELARTAAMQGFFRERVDFVPLNAADFELNAKGHGADGSAGYFLNMPDGQRPRIFVNVESRRADVEPHEFYEAFFSSDAFSPEQKASMRAAVDNRYGADGLMARGREYAESLIKAENAKNFPNDNLFVTSEQIAAKMDQLAQDELGRGGQDALDWVRREVMVEEARMAGIDYAAMRRNVPAGQNPITFIENLLGANARALGLSGVRVDPETGMAITPEQLFKENPVAAGDPKLVKQLNGYLKTYKQWLNDPQHETPKGTRIAPDGRAESLANNPNVKFYDGANGKENSIAFVDASGRVIEKTPRQRAKERKVRGQQIRNMVGSKILEPGNTTFGLKRWNDGRIRAGGKRLPDVMALQTHWKAHLPVIRSIEALSDAGESQQVLYFAKGNSADKVKSSRLSDIDAINREMVFDQWTTNAAGDLLAQFLDLTSVRNRAMKAIAERHPALDPANGGPGYKLQAIMDDVNQWMADKSAGKAGEATIGVPRKNVVNALINPGTNFNRGKNDLAGAFGRGSAIKTLLLEGINAVSGTGRKGAAMDYAWANGNFMPDKPAPRPNMDGDLVAPRAIKDLSTDQILRELEENQGYLGLSTLGMREGRPVKGGAQQTRELLKRNTALNEELRRRGGTQEESDVERVLRQRGQAMPNVDADYMAAVDAGNLEAAQRILDDAAVGSGKVVAWHGDGGRPDKTEFTKGYKFRLERNGKSEILGFFAEKPHTSEPYGEPKKYYLQLSKALDALIPQELNAGLMQHKTLDAWKRFFKSKGVDGEIKFDSAIQEDPYKGGSKVAGKPKKYFLYEVLDNNTGYWNGDGTIMQRLVESGFDSIVYSEQGDRSWIVFGEPSQIKSADVIAKDNAGSIVLPSQRFGPATGRTRGQAMPDVADAPPFYLKSSQAIDAKVQGKAATPDQIKAILTNPQNGIKAEELKWTGVMQEVERLAKENNGKVPKDALLRYLAEDGAVRLEEVTTGEVTMPASQIMRMVDAGERIDIFDQKFGRAISYDELGFFGPNEMLTVRRDQTTKYGSYQLPGGENYREVVLAMPNPISGKSKQITDKYGIPYETSSAYLLQQAGATLEEIRQYQSGIEGASFVPTDYRSTHFDTPNYAAHMRLNDRVDAKGKPGLFIEELQSDRHQQGREKGYKEDSNAERDALNERYKEAVARRNAARDALEASTETGDVRDATDRALVQAFQNAQMNMEQAAGERRRSDAGSIPDAPFRTSWPLQLFKRALRDAVADGKDWIGWTTGETQAARYDLSKQVDSVNVSRGGGETWEIWADKDGRNAVRKDVNSIAEVAEVIGKELAKKVEDMKPGESARTFSGVDLKVGGEGMKGFYDTMVPKEVAKYVKQWGGQVEKDRIGKPKQGTGRMTRDEVAEARKDARQLIRGDISVEEFNDAHGTRFTDDDVPGNDPYQLSVGVQTILDAMREQRKQEAGGSFMAWRVNITPQMREGIKKAGQALFAAGTAAVVADQEQE